MPILRRSAKSYHMFTLAHFILFDVDNPLLHPSQTVTDTFNSGEFSPAHLQIPDNWEAIYECQDERDAERTWRRSEQARGTRNNKGTAWFHWRRKRDRSCSGEDRKLKGAVRASGTAR